MFASDAIKIAGAAVGVGTVYGLARGVSYIKICPELLDEGVQEVNEEIDAREVCLATLILSSLTGGVDAGMVVGIPLALGSCVGSLPTLNMCDVIKPLSLGFGVLWGASMVGARMGYSAAYHNYKYANKIIEQRGKGSWGLRDETDQDELLKCKSARLAALNGANCFTRVGIYGLSITLTGWAYYKRYQNA